MNRNKINMHRAKLAKIITSFYQDSTMMTIIGFKGGTAAMFLYDLPRLSIDLDFDLLQEERGEMIIKKIPILISSVGQIKEIYNKRNTIFALVSYDATSWNIKVEISKRKTSSVYQKTMFLGTSIMAINKPGMVAGKLGALLTRKLFAGRDVFDLWYFLNKQWPIDAVVVKEMTGYDVATAFEKAQKKVAGLKPNVLLQGYGEFITDIQKDWVRHHLQKELISLLEIARKFPIMV